MVLNTALMRNPWNWVTIMLMVLIGAFAINSMAKLVMKDRS